MRHAISILIAGVSLLPLQAQAQDTPAPSPAPAVRPEAPSAPVPTTAAPQDSPAPVTVAPQAPPQAAPPANANSLEDIVVTAQRRSESLHNVPISISAIGSEQIAQRGITGLASGTGTVLPGLTVAPNAGVTSILMVNIRGVTNGDPSQGTVELGTGTYIDDVYLGRAQGLGLELADPERIEVLRGPQGTLFGRNTEGGAIRIVTKKPTGEFDGTIKATIGDYGRRRVEAHVDLPAIAGIAVKVDFLKSHLDGYTDNGPRDARLLLQKDFGYGDDTGVRASARWKPLSGLTIDYAFDRTLGKHNGDYFVQAVPDLAKYPAARTPIPGAPLDETYDKRADRSFIPLYNPYFRDIAQGHSLQMQYVASDVITLKSITAFRKLDSVGAQQLGGVFAFVPFTLTPGLMSPLPLAAMSLAPGVNDIGLPASANMGPLTNVYGVSGVVPYAEVHQKQESQELQLIGTTKTFTFTLGAYYYHERVRDVRQTFFSIMYLDPAFATPIGTNPFSLPFPGQGKTISFANATSLAAYAQGTWTPEILDNKLHFTGGVRYTHDKKTFFRSQTGGDSSPAGQFTPKEFLASRWDPSATIAYEFTPAINTYFRYAQAYRAGGASVRAPDYSSFGAEVNKSLELGVKANLFHNRVRLNGAIFQNRISGRQLSRVIPTGPRNPNADPTLTDIINAPGITRIRGIELEATARVARGLTIDMSYAYQKSKQPTAALALLDPLATYNVENTPEHAGTIAVDYSFPSFGFATLELHTDYSITSPGPNTPRVPIGAFEPDVKRDVANARVSLTNIKLAGPVKGRISVFVNNIFDTAYPVFSTESNNAVISPPRTFGFEFGTTF
jgi:iron complex outermembrane receptor protein